LIICSLILYFSKSGDRFRGGYPVTAEFSNAGGLIKGAQVLYAGVLVGKVDSIALKPDGAGVGVSVNMFKRMMVRKDARFLIKQSGLLGDQHIVIVPTSTTAPRLAAGDVVQGNDPFDFSDAASQAGEAIRKLNQAIDKISSEVLQGDTVENIKQGIKNFADLTIKLQSSSDYLNVILNDAQKGKGTLGKLLTNDQLFEEMKRLIHNWRVHGLLYREEEEERYPAPRKSPTSFSDE